MIVCSCMCVYACPEFYVISEHMVVIYNILCVCVGIAVDTELFCRTESSALTDPTLWTFVLAEQRDTHGQSDKEKGILITTVCTILAFVLGVFSGLIAYRCVSAFIIKRKADPGRQSEAPLIMNIEQSGSFRRVHYNKSENSIKVEASDAYDEVVSHYSKPGMPDVQMKLNKNVAYGL
jgi:hypothetical protein